MKGLIQLFKQQLNLNKLKWTICNNIKLILCNLPTEIDLLRHSNLAFAIFLFLQSIVFKQDFHDYPAKTNDSAVLDNNRLKPHFGVTAKPYG